MNLTNCILFIYFTIINVYEHIYQNVQKLFNWKLLVTFFK